MIKVNIKEDEITIKGHSGYSEEGSDIVCASVSSISITTVNALLSIDEDCITYEEALTIAKTFLSEYEPRITEEYLSGLHVSSAYYDFWGDPLTTVTKKEHAQVWIIQFGEEHHSGEYMVRCDAYIDAITGRVVCIDIGIDMRYPNDWDNYTSIDFKN